MFFYLLRGFSEWLFIIGVYGVTRQLVTRPPPGLARLSELAMPFYLTHQQILVPIAAACSWVPYLSKIHSCQQTSFLKGFTSTIGNPLTLILRGSQLHI